MVHSFLLILLLFSASFSTDLRAMLGFGDRFYRDSLFTQALEQYERYLASAGSAPEVEQVLLKTAQIHRREGDLVRSLERYGRLIGEYPRSPFRSQALFERAELLSDAGRYREALDDYRAIWRDFSSTQYGRLSLFRLGSYSVSSGSPDEGEEHLFRFIALFPRDSLAGPARVSLSEVLFQRRAYSEAAEVISAGLETLPPESVWRGELLAIRGDIYKQMQQPDSARSHYEKAIATKQLFPRHRKTLFAYATLMFESESFTEDGFNSIYSIFTEHYKNDAEFSEKKLMGDIALQMGRLTLADELLRSSLGMVGADSASVLFALSRRAVVAGDTYSAIEYLGKIDRSHGDDRYGEALQRIAKLYASSGIPFRAIETYRRYLAEGFEERADLSSFEIGRLYEEELRAPELAIREYDLLIRTATTGEYVSMAHWRMGRLQERLGDNSGALSTYRYITSRYRGTELADMAKRRLNYLESHVIPSFDRGVAGLAELIFTPPQDEGHRYLLGARFYREILKNYSGAVDLIDRLLERDDLTPNQRGRALIEAAHIWTDTYNKLLFEESLESASAARDFARGYYDSILSNNNYERFSEEALYFRARDLAEDISELREFVSAYPDSRFAPEAALAVANTLSLGGASSGDLHGYYKRAFASSNRSVRERSVSGIIDIYLREGAVDSARVWLQRYSSAEGSGYNPHLLYPSLGRVALASGEYAVSESLFVAYIRNYPESDNLHDSWLYLGEALLQRGRPNESLRYFSLAETAFPSGERGQRAALGSIRTLALLGRTAEVIQRIDDLYRSGVDSSLRGVLAFERGKIHEALGETYASLQWYEQAFELMPEREDVASALADAYFEMRQYKQAADLYSHLRSLGDTPARTGRFLSASILAGVADDVSGEYSSFRRGASRGGYEDELSEVVFSEGLFAYREKDYRRAENRFSYVVDRLSTTPFVDNAAYYRALIAFDRGDLDDAFRQLQRFIDGYPASPLIASALFTQATIHNRREEFEQAARLFDRVSEISSEDRELHFRSLMNGAALWQRLSFWQRSAERYEMVYSTYPERVDRDQFLLRIGFAYFQAEEWSRAYPFFKKASEGLKGGDRAEADYWIGRTLYQIGRVEDALEILIKIPYLYGYGAKWGVTAEFEAARIYEEIERFTEATSLYSKVLRMETASSPMGRQAQEALQRIQQLRQR